LYFVLRPLYFVLRMYDHKDAWSQADAIREQQLNWRQSRSSWVWPHGTSAHWRCYCTRLLVHQSRKLRRCNERGETSEAYPCVQPYVKGAI